MAPRAFRYAIKAALRSIVVRADHAMGLPQWPPFSDRPSMRPPPCSPLSEQPTGAPSMYSVGPHEALNFGKYISSLFAVIPLGSRASIGFPPAYAYRFPPPPYPIGSSCTNRRT